MMSKMHVNKKLQGVGVSNAPPQSVEDLLMSVKKKCEMHFKKNK